MKRALAGLATMALLVAACGGSDDDAAETDAFVVPGGGYSVEFPKEPEATEIPIAMPSGVTLSADAWIDEHSDGAFLTYAVDYEALLGDEYVAWNDPQAQLESIRDGSVDAVGATLLESELVELDGRDGIRYTYEFDQDGVTGHGVSVAYVDEPMMWYAGGVGLGDEQDETAAFVDSFAFVDAAVDGTEGPAKEADE